MAASSISAGLDGGDDGAGVGLAAAARERAPAVQAGGDQPGQQPPGPREQLVAEVDGPVQVEHVAVVQELRALGGTCGVVGHLRPSPPG
jgi:hypothetical protein